MLSAAVMVVDSRFDFLRPVRSQMGMVLSPVYDLAHWPAEVWGELTEQVSSRSELMAENERLKAEALLLQGRQIGRAHV